MQRRELIGFTGRYLDQETGLWYFRARYENPILGRFASRDPWQKKRTAPYMNWIHTEIFADSNFKWRPTALDGYHDGMSLYQTYYVPNSVDAFGTTCGTWTVVAARVTYNGITGDGYEATFDDTGCSCKCGKVVQVISGNGNFSHVDASDDERRDNNAESAPPGHPMPAIQPLGSAGALSFTDGPGITGNTLLDATYTATACAFCADPKDADGNATKDGELLGCVKIVFHSKGDTTGNLVTPASPKSIPSIAPDGNFNTGSKKWHNP